MNMKLDKDAAQNIFPQQTRERLRIEKADGLRMAVQVACTKAVMHFILQTRVSTYRHIMDGLLFKPTKTTKAHSKIQKCYGQI